MDLNPEKFAVVVNVLAEDGHVCGVASFPTAEDSLSAIEVWVTEQHGVQFIKGEHAYEAAKHRATAAALRAEAETLSGFEYTTRIDTAIQHERAADRRDVFGAQVIG